MKLIDLSGKRFGALTVFKRVENRGKHVAWECSCVCGQNVVVTTTNLRTGHTTTCSGSIHRIKPAAKKRHDLYQVWKEMRRRCFDPRSTSYPYYGAKGVTVCEEWSDFWAFVADVGQRPSPAHQLDRVRSKEGYHKDNVRWVTAGENSRNRDFVKLDDDAARRVKRLLATGKKAQDIAPDFGVSVDCIRDISSGRTWRHVGAPNAADGINPQEQPQ